MVEKKACGEAYELTQTLRRGGKLSDARKPAIVCSRDVCADFIRVDCARWLGEIDASLPTVVFTVRDAAGQETGAVRVSLDGKPWLDRLDGSARAIDPGEHHLRFEIDGAPALDQTVQIREGEKNRALGVSFQTKPAPPDTTAAPGAGRPVWAWIAVGAGVASLGVAVGFGVDGLSAKSTIDSTCHGQSPCPGLDPSQADALNGRKDRGLGVFIGAGAAGVAGITAGLVGLLGRRSRANATSALVVTPLLGPQLRGAALEGRF
jgi:hypothetical protein